MAQQATELAATWPKDQSSSPRTHVMEGENPLSQVTLIMVSVGEHV